MIRQALAPLVRLPMRHIARSSSMLWLDFGEPREISGGTKIIYDWTIQIQCPWRISQGTRIVLAYRNFFYSDAPLTNVAVMNKSRSNSILDGLCAEFAVTPPVVASTDSEDNGAFSLRMTSDYCLDVFPAEGAESGKLWRIFEPGHDGRSFVFPPSET